MRLFKRVYQTEDDYWQLRALLRKVFLLNGRQELSWQVARLDYWRYFGNENIEHYQLNDAICLWETENHEIVAFITPESRGHVYLQVHPAFRSLDLEMSMLESAETRLAEVDKDGMFGVTVWAHQHDEMRQQALRNRGYIRGDWPEYQFARSLNESIPEPKPAADYSIRSLGDSSELPARSLLSWRVFHPNEPDENYGGWEWYLDVQRCPLYRRDLDLIAVDPNGELAAFATVWYDDVTRTGYFEPVGTLSNHQRKGLGKAIMTEGLHRLRRMGAIHATVAGYSEAARALYASVMKKESHIYERWHKSWPAAN